MYESVVFFADTAFDAIKHSAESVTRALLLRRPCAIFVAFVAMGLVLSVVTVVVVFGRVYGGRSDARVNRRHRRCRLGKEIRNLYATDGSDFFRRAAGRLRDGTSY